MADNTSAELALIREKFGPVYDKLFALEIWAEEKFDKDARHQAFQARCKVTEFENVVRFKLEQLRKETERGSR